MSSFRAGHRLRTCPSCGRPTRRRQCTACPTGHVDRYSDEAREQQLESLIRREVEAHLDGIYPRR